MRKIIIAILCGITLTGCSVAKMCKEPQLDIPEHMAQDMAQDSMCIADLTWIEVFADTLLTDLIKQSLEHNKDLLTASARVREYERLHRISRADFFPAIGAKAHVDRETNQNPTDGFSADLEVTAKLTLSWEVDFFGRLRWTDKKALASYMQTIEAKRALQMTLVAEVATAYFELIALDRELEIVERTLTTRKENLHQAKLRFEGGLTSEIPYQQAQVEYARTAAMVPDLQMKIKLKENEISFLTGRTPTTIHRSKKQALSIPHNMLHVGLPSDLITRRPDVREAEQSLQAAMAQVGVDWAERFPRFVIGLEGGLENAQFEGFLQSPLTYMIGEITAPIFAFGKRKAKYDAAIEAYEGARYQYEERVIQAFKEVNDAVVEYTSAEKNTQLMNDLRSSARKYVELARFQYLNGQINYIDVLDAQRSYFNAEIDQSNAIRDQYLALINMYKALGGGWQNIEPQANE